ncbi:MAG: response regulator transcription factor [Nitrospirae bacterium]|nr:MAG: response regulator transcription factor [Nitrospirota bacterium]
MNDKIVARIKDSLKTVEEASTTKPLILIDDNGSYWLNDHADVFISERNIPLKDLMEWLMIGSAHLQNFRYGDITISMMRLPGNSVIAFLTGLDADQVSEKPVLTDREREVLRYLVKGFSNKEIAAAMKITPETVNSYLDKIYEKLDCSNRVAAAFLGLKNGFFLPACQRLEKNDINNGT